LSEQEIIEIMDELTARNTAVKVDVGWVKT